MTEPVDPLLLQFASDRPDEMASLLANTELQELSAMLQSLPVASAASLAARLPSWQLSGLLGTVDPALLARMLRAAKTDEAVALVSHLNESRYASILDAVPAPERRSLYELLEFPSYSVASLVTTDFIRVPENTSCRVFCEQLSASTDTSPRPVLVINQQGKYYGILSLTAAYSRRNRARPVGQVATNVEPLNGNTAASTALTARQWMKYSELPVVDSRHRILGVVNRAALERVAGDSTPLEFNFERVLSELASAYLSLCARVLESVLGRPK
tara:strand:+ start:16029 stop:16844 length:816 start_codon:yes stop_codon:yes gene_type:complete